MKRLNYFWIFLILAGASFGAWDNDLPADSSVWDQAPGFIRNNWDEIEKVLGIDLSMEGSASPWYQAAAPTTTADGSTGLDSGNDGLMWIDSDTRILSIYIDGTGFVGADALPDVVTFTSSDATPTVALSSRFTTDSGGLTITDFDDGTDGKVIYVLSKGTVIYDTTTAQDIDHNLDGSSADITTASGDITVWRNEGGSTWHLVVFNDASVDNAEKDFATTTYVNARALKATNTSVFLTSMSSASTFQDLDLSGTVGSNVAMVHLQVTVGAAGDQTYVAKVKGIGSNTFTEYYNQDESVGGCTIQSETAVPTIGHMTLRTDSSGVIQHGFTDNTTTITVTLLSWQAAL